MVPQKPNAFASSFLRVFRMRPAGTGSKPRLLNISSPLIITYLAKHFLILEGAHALLRARSCPVHSRFIESALPMMIYLYEVVRIRDPQCSTMRMIRTRHHFSFLKRRISARKFVLRTALSGSFCQALCSANDMKSLRSSKEASINYYARKQI